MPKKKPLNATTTPFTRGAPIRGDSLVWAITNREHAKRLGKGGRLLDLSLNRPGPIKRISPAREDAAG